MSGWDWVLVKPSENGAACRFCGLVCEFYTLGCDPDPDARYGHEPVPWVRSDAPGPAAMQVTISGQQARQHADFILSHGGQLSPLTMVALGYLVAQRTDMTADQEVFPLARPITRYRITEAGAAVMRYRAGQEYDW